MTKLVKESRQERKKQNIEIAKPERYIKQGNNQNIYICFFCEFNIHKFCHSQLFVILRIEFLKFSIPDVTDEKSMLYVKISLILRRQSGFMEQMYFTRKKQSITRNMRITYAIFLLFGFVLSLSFFEE